MKPTIPLLLLAVVALLPSCAAPSDSAFMTTSAARILPGDGVVQDSNGRMMLSRGLDNHNRPHPFFGTP